jgi:hypothetical protein
VAGAPAEEAALVMNSTPGLRVAGATLASVTLPGTAPTVTQWRTLDAWIVTLDFPRPFAMPLGCGHNLETSRAQHGCTFVVSKNVVYVDARTGASAILVSTN